MPRYVAFLRAVNVGGPHTVKMDALRRVFEGLGFSNVASYIASGNIIFETTARNTSLLEHRIERGLLQAFGQELLPFIRSGRELAEIVSCHAFPDAPLGTGDQLAVVFLSAPPHARAVKALEQFESKTDAFRGHGREIYWLRHLDETGAAYSAVPLDKALSEPFTIRSMSTLRKIAEKFFANE